MKKIEIIEDECSNGVNTICCLCGDIVFAYESQNMVLIDGICYRAHGICAKEHKDKPIEKIYFICSRSVK